MNHGKPPTKALTFHHDSHLHCFLSNSVILFQNFSKIDLQREFDKSILKSLPLRNLGTGLLRKANQSFDFKFI